MTRTLPADLEMGIAQQTTRGVARTLVLELMVDGEEKGGRKDEWGRSIKMGGYKGALMAVQVAFESQVHRLMYRNGLSRRGRS